MMGATEMSDEEREAQLLEWEAFVAKCHAEGRCEYSGLMVSRCVQSICDCFETPEGAAEIERKAGLR